MKQLINIYVGNKIGNVCLDYSKIQKSPYCDSFKLLIDSEYKAVRIQEINTIFPNVKQIWFSNINLCTSILDEILVYLTNLSDNSAKRKVIQLENFNKSSEITVSMALSKYQSQFKQIKYDIAKGGGHDGWGEWLYINHETYDENDGCFDELLFTNVDE